ncbi:unnamed protein product [Brassica napus]|uniref:(rape) hypothetical protein n=1 Tax=Brassica napus TaxID=3708 RepID=A0A816R3Y8_BRANA|nr:unnamed protein product [Brassica napus]
MTKRAILESGLRNIIIYYYKELKRSSDYVITINHKKKKRSCKLWKLSLTSEHLHP